MCAGWREWELYPMDGNYNCLLCVVCCVLSAVCCLLCVVCCVLCAVCCLLCVVCCVLSAVCCLLCAVCCVLSAVCCLLCVCAGGVKVALTYETYELGYTDDLQDPNSSRFLAHRQKVCSDVSEAFSFLPFHWHLCLPISIFMKNAYVCIQNLKQE